MLGFDLLLLSDIGKLSGDGYTAQLQLLNAGGFGGQLAFQFTQITMSVLLGAAQLLTVLLN